MCVTSAPCCKCRLPSSQTAKNVIFQCTGVLQDLISQSSSHCVVAVIRRTPMPPEHSKQTWYGQCKRWKAVTSDDKSDRVPVFPSPAGGFHSRQLISISLPPPLLHLLQHYHWTHLQHSHKSAYIDHKPTHALSKAIPSQHVIYKQPNRRCQATSHHPHSYRSTEIPILPALHQAVPADCHDQAREQASS